MMKRIKNLLIATVMVLSIVSCREADRVSYNISKQADNFNVVRKVTVINTYSDKTIFEMVGTLSVNRDEDGDLAILVQTGPKEYKKHFVSLPMFTMYTVEDLCGTEVSNYKYEVRYTPQMLIPVNIERNKPTGAYDVDLSEYE